jgi:hypothetical protein
MIFSKTALADDRVAEDRSKMLGRCTNGRSAVIAPRCTACALQGGVLCVNRVALGSQATDYHSRVLKRCDPFIYMARSPCPDPGLFIIGATELASTVVVL